VQQPEEGHLAGARGQAWHEWNCSSERYALADRENDLRRATPLHPTTDGIVPGSTLHGFDLPQVQCVKSCVAPNSERRAGIADDSTEIHPLLDVPD
jgi:hypothetical protein